MLFDYEDFLRINRLPIWDKDHGLVVRLREINKSVPKPTYETFRKAIEHKSPEICANTMITLINITINLLGQQVKKFEADFIKEGGLRERITKARIEIRKKRQ